MLQTVTGSSSLLIIRGALIGLGLILDVFFMGVLVQTFEISFLKNNEKSVGNTFVLGFLFTVALSQIILVPMSLYCVRVLTATIVWWVIFITLSILMVVKRKELISEILLSTKKRVKDFVSKNCGGIYGVLSIVFIAVQILGSIVLYHYDDDDSIYVTTVASNITSNHFWHVYGPTGEETSLWSMSQYLTNGWYNLLTVICKSTNIPAAILMHTILPPLMIALAYVVVVLFAKLLIKRDTQRYLFILFVSLINILNNVSTHTSSSVLLMRMHQGKALFANIIVPVMFCAFLQMWESNENKKNILILIMANICACAFSTTGLAFGTVLTVLFALIYVVYKKSVKDGIGILFAIIPNFVFLMIYVIERIYEVWGC